MLLLSHSPTHVSPQTTLCRVLSLGRTGVLPVPTTPRNRHRSAIPSAAPAAGRRHERERERGRERERERRAVRERVRREGGRKAQVEILSWFKGSWFHPGKPTVCALNTKQYGPWSHLGGYTSTGGSSLLHSITSAGIHRLTPRMQGV